MKIWDSVYISGIQMNESCPTTKWSEIHGHLGEVTYHWNTGQYVPGIQMVPMYHGYILCTNHSNTGPVQWGSE